MGKSPPVARNVSRLSGQSHHRLREKLRVEVEAVSIEDEAEEGKTAALMFQLLSSINDNSSVYIKHYIGNPIFFSLEEKKKKKITERTTSRELVLL